MANEADRIREAGRNVRDADLCQEGSNASLCRLSMIVPEMICCNRYRISMICARNDPFQSAQDVHELCPE